MTTAQVTLTESEARAVQALSRSKGKTQEEISHDALEQFLARHKIEDRSTMLRLAPGARHLAGTGRFV